MSIDEGRQTDSCEIADSSLRSGGELCDGGKRIRRPDDPDMSLRIFPCGVGSAHQ